MVSTIKGVDDDDFTRYYSIALTHSFPVRTGGLYEKQLALYPDLSCIRHSCYPNASFRRRVGSPFWGSCIAARIDGVAAGDEVSILYPKVAFLMFLLLPRERRHQLLRTHYGIGRCACSRCWKRQDSLEDSLTGAYWHPIDVSDESFDKDGYARELRERFDQLCVIQNGTSEWIANATQRALTSWDQHVESATRCVRFVKHYSDPTAPLQLHENHWRLSAARIMYLMHMEWLIDHRSSEATRRKSELTDGNSGPSAVTVKLPLDKYSFELAASQLRVESRMVPQGHPLSLLTYRRWKRMVALLPDTLAQRVQRTAAAERSISWEVLSIAERKHR
jgi:hypothetical protein